MHFFAISLSYNFMGIETIGTPTLFLALIFASTDFSGLIFLFVSTSVLSYLLFSIVPNYLVLFSNSSFFNNFFFIGNVCTTKIRFTKLI